MRGIKSCVFLLYLSLLTSCFTGETEIKTSSPEYAESPYCKKSFLNLRKRPDCLIFEGQFIEHQFRFVPCHIPKKMTCDEVDFWSKSMQSALNMADYNEALTFQDFISESKKNLWYLNANTLKVGSIDKASGVISDSNDVAIQLSTFSDKRKYLQRDSVTGEHQVDMELDELIYVYPGTKLILKEGSKIHFKEGGGIVCFGSLVVDGTLQNPVVITGDPGNKGMYFDGRSESEVKIKHCKISGLEAGAKARDIDLSWFYGAKAAVQFYDLNLTLDQVSFSNLTGSDGVHIYNSKFSIENLRINKCQGDGLDIDFSDGELAACEIRDCGDDALDLSGSNLNAKRVNLRFAKDKGLSVGEASTVSFDKLDISECKIALAVKDASQAAVTSANFNNNKLQLAVFEKKKKYGPAYLNFAGSCVKHDDYYMLETGSSLVINKEVMDGGRPNVKKYLSGEEYGE